MIVQDGSEAVTRYAAARYDLILMDCQMPGMDGFEADAPDPRATADHRPGPCAHRGADRQAP